MEMAAAVRKIVRTDRDKCVAHMEVPCCFALVRIVEAALTAAHKGDIPMTDVTVGLDGRVKE
jgi:hypothetical protein